MDRACLRRVAALACAVCFAPVAARADDAAESAAVIAPAVEVATADPVPPPAPAFAPSPGLVPALEPVPADRLAPAEPSAIEQRRAIVSSGRGLAGHTALTVPAGNVEVSVRSVVPVAGLATISAGLTSTTELSGEVGGLFDPGDRLTVVGAGIKQALLRSDRVQLSIGGGIRRVSDAELDGITLVQLGATLSVCADPRCRVLLSGGLSGVQASGEDGTLQILSLGLSAGSQHTRLLGEVFVLENAMVMLGGLRFGNAKFSGDLGLVTVVNEGTGVLPFAGFATRM